MEKREEKSSVCWAFPCSLCSLGTSPVRVPSHCAVCDQGNHFVAPDPSWLGVSEEAVPLGSLCCCRPGPEYKKKNEEWSQLSRQLSCADQSGEESSTELWGEPQFRPEDLKLKRRGKGNVHLWWGQPSQLSDGDVASRTCICLCARVCAYVYVCRHTGMRLLVCLGCLPFHLVLEIRPLIGWSAALSQLSQASRRSVCLPVILQEFWGEELGPPAYRAST